MTKIYPGGDPKWQWQSGLSHITQNSFPFVSFDKEGIINVFIKTVLPWFSNIYNDRQQISLFTYIEIFKTHDIIHPCQM